MVESLVQRARTKTVATVGPACNDPAILAELVAAGADVFRINMAHGSREEHERFISDIRRISDETNQPIAILVDLAGPKIRLGELLVDPTDCADGAEFQFVRGDSSDNADQLVSNYPQLIDELAVDDRVMLADGTVAMRVVSKHDDRVRCVVTGSGIIRSRQGINLPGVKLSVPALTDSDKDNAVWAATAGVDFISLSFVRSAAELHELRKLISDQGSQAHIVAKIEKPEALERLEEIVAAADVVMVARGDLGVEIDVAETPVAQKRIIDECRQQYKPVIVATEMLDSMQHSRRPTRAEVSDVANAILDGADACMLSGETAIGKFPRETVEMMNRIMMFTEKLLRGRPSQLPDAPPADLHPITGATVYGAAQIAQRLDSRLVVIATHSGATARAKSKQRDFIPTIGVSDSVETLRHMCMYWGIVPLAGAPANDSLELRKFIADWGKAEGSLQANDKVVFVTGSQLVPHAHNMVVVDEIQ